MPGFYPAEWNPTLHELFLSYWTVEQGWSTELEIRNNVAWRDLTVTPVLRMADGAEIALQPVTVPPEHVASVDVREALFAIAPDLLDRNGSFGSVVYRYPGMSKATSSAPAWCSETNRPSGFILTGNPSKKSGARRPRKAYGGYREQLPPTT
jgi:hypothetical protein